MSPQNETTKIGKADTDSPAIEEKLDLHEILRRLQRTELEMLALKVRNLSLLDTCTDGVLLVDARGLILAVNKQAATMFGYEPAELLFQQVEILVPESRRASHVQYRRGYNLAPTSRPMGQGITMGLQGQRKDGSLFHLGISLAHVSVEATPVTAVVCTILR